MVAAAGTSVEGGRGPWWRGCATRRACLELFVWNAKRLRAEVALSLTSDLITNSVAQWSRRETYSSTMVTKAKACDVAIIGSRSWTQKKKSLYLHRNRSDREELKITI